MYSIVSLLCAIIVYKLTSILIIETALATNYLDKANRKRKFAFDVDSNIDPTSFPIQCVCWRLNTWIQEARQF
ncbi:hypothetical protein RJT34_32797 [Clitoria ternatea]|uniref:Uncharacterized protein n=1 Tax=Clitoria ternatea TaxID=43366 RepID=A0AAN9I9V1_CLITE